MRPKQQIYDLSNKYVAQTTNSFSKQLKEAMSRRADVRSAAALSHECFKTTSRSHPVTSLREHVGFRSSRAQSDRVCGYVVKDVRV